MRFHEDKAAGWGVRVFYNMDPPRAEPRPHRPWVVLQSTSEGHEGHHGSTRGRNRPLPQGPSAPTTALRLIASSELCKTTAWTVNHSDVPGSSSGILGLPLKRRRRFESCRARQARLLRQELRRLLGRHRPRKVEPLGHVATHLSKQLGLICALHALCYDLHP